MATAREKLVQQLIELLQNPFSDAQKSLLKNIIYAYRVQVGSESESERLGNGSARQKLFNAVVEVWANNINEDIENALRDIMRVFRMQVKPSRKKVTIVAETSTAPDAHTVSKAQFKTFFPVAGGPKTNSSKRGECPKCRSAGIVLAHESSGEDHFSCIYCGFQMFQSRKQGGGLGLSVAAQLLGRKFNESDNEV